MTESFKKAAEEVMILKKQPNYDEFGELYGFYKQATVGDVNTDRPGIFDLKGRGKWDAWHKKKGLSKDKAMASYVDYVEEMKAKYGI